MIRLLLALVLAAAVVPPGAAAHDRRLAAPAASIASVKAPCPGTDMRPDRVIVGRATTAQEGSYLMVPFRVPRGTTAVRVKYCHDQPDRAVLPQARHTIDLGLYEPARRGRSWGPRQLRGWGGSSHPDVTVSPEGFAPYGTQEPGRTTRAFRPGPVRRGRWAVELGLAAIMGPELGDSDGGVEYRVEIELSDDPAFADEPYVPARPRTRSGRRGPGWFAGDLHVHGEHSALGDAPLEEVLSYAFEEAGLDFFTLSDYVGGAQWDEMGRFARAYPDHLVMRSAEVITYRGHINNHASARTVDHRTGPVLLRRRDGDLDPLRPARPARSVLRRIRAAGGVTQINHPTIFPSPTSRLLCRGCPWDYDDAETDYGSVDAIEVATGPAGLQDAPGDLGPNPFTLTALDFYERALRTGAHIAAVGSSDSHNAGRRSNPVTQSPIGQATTVVRARRLSEAAIACGIRRGHTFVKVWGSDRPDLRLRARNLRVSRTAIFGDTLRADDADFTASVTGAAPVDGQPFALQVVRNGTVVATHPVPGDELEVRFVGQAPGRYGLRLVRGSAIEAVSTPVWLEPAGSSRPRRERRPCR